MLFLINYFLGVIMVDSMKLHLESMGPINEANINISKITVVGGYNSAGKSTLSKILYSFLRSNSFNRQEIAYESISQLMRTESMYFSKLLKKYGIKFRFPHFKLKDVYDIERILEKYEEIKSLFYELDIPENDLENLIQHFNVIDDLINVVDEDSDELYISLMRKLLESEFSSNNFNFLFDIDNSFSIDFKNFDFDDDNAFKSCNNIIVNDIFYIDSVSILDTFEFRKSVDHLEFLKKNLRSKSRQVFDDKINKNIIDLEKDINHIINGKFIFERGEFKFISNSNIQSDMQNTASGIKQIGLIQLLLANRKLKENSFLIIDEPEVNLHPDWQFLLAKILVLIVKKLNVSVYINTHSPLFIESIHTFSHYFDISDKTTYHLAESNGVSFDINEVDESHLSKIYDNLGNAYFEMDILRLEKELD